MIGKLCVLLKVMIFFIVVIGLFEFGIEVIFVVIVVFFVLILLLKIFKWCVLGLIKMIFFFL